MTNADVMAQILSEASRKPIGVVRELMKAMAPQFGSALHNEISEERVQELLASLREELPGIRRWLFEGAARKSGR
jgi:hypothetical protein